MLGQEHAPTTALAVRAALPHASGLTRRHFLQRVVTGIAGAAVASTLDYEQLLWSPGEKTIFLPEPYGDTLVELDWLAREVLRLLEKRLTVGRHFNRRYVDAFATGGGRVGDTVRVPLPTRFVPQPDDEPIDWFAPITQQILPVTLDQQYAVELDADALRRCRSLEEVSRCYAQPAAAQLAQVIRDERLDVFSDLALPATADKALALRDPEAGLSIRGLEYDILEHRTGEWRKRLRVDFLAGSSKGRLHDER